MTDFVWPNGVRMSSIDWRHISNSEAFQGTYGIAQTVSRPGDRLGCTVSVRNSTGTERAKLRALAAALRGSANRIYLRDFSYRRAGTMVAPELFSNQDFSGGTTGWSSDSRYTLSASNGVLRCSVAQNVGTAAYAAYQNVTQTQFAPYATRVCLRSGLGAFASINLVVDGVVQTALSSSLGYGVGSTIVQNSSSAGVYDASTTGPSAGDYFDILMASAARCIQVDGGGNLFTRSDEFDNAAWTKSNSSIVANSSVSPDGTSTMDALIENSSTAQHYVTQGITVTSTAQDVMIAVVAAQAGRQYILLQMQENTSSTAVERYFNLASGGSVGTTNSTGANWSNQRAFVKNLGNNRILCVLIARKTNVATSIGCYIMAASADGTKSYLGVGTQAVALWRATAWPTGVPSRLVQSTTAAVATQTQNTSGIYVKGLPVSTTSALAISDQVEIDKQLKFTQTDVTSDSIGQAYLQVDSPCARALADNTPVIVEKPMAKFYLARDVEYPSEPGTKSSNKSNFTFEFEQDLAS